MCSWDLRGGGGVRVKASHPAGVIPRTVPSKPFPPWGAGDNSVTGPLGAASSIVTVGGRACPDLGCSPRWLRAGSAHDWLPGPPPDRSDSLTLQLPNSCGQSDGPCSRLVRAVGWSGPARPRDRPGSTPRRHPTPGPARPAQARQREPGRADPGIGTGRSRSTPAWRAMPKTRGSRRGRPHSRDILLGLLGPNPLNTR